jgi:hypothetical protein
LVELSRFTSPVKLSRVNSLVKLSRLSSPVDPLLVKDVRLAVELWTPLLLGLVGRLWEEDPSKLPCLESVAGGSCRPRRLLISASTTCRAMLIASFLLALSYNLTSFSLAGRSFGVVLGLELRT